MVRWERNAMKKCFLPKTPFILHGGLVGASSLWPIGIARTTMNTFGPSTRAPPYEVLYLTYLLLYMKGIMP
jgi:hypothetical protein